MKPKLNMDKVRKFTACKENEQNGKIREGYYSHQGQPLLAHVYKDRSFKAALELELKPLKCHPKELWNWRK